MTGRRGVSLFFALFVLVLLSAVGCRTITSDLAEAAVDPAVGAAVTSALEALAEPENQGLINELLALEGIELASERAGRGLLRGMLSLLVMDASGGGPKANDAMSERFRQMGEQMGQDLSPVVVAIVTDMVDAIMREIFSPASRREAAAFAGAVAREATAASMEALAQGLVEHVGPALAQIIERDMGPALTRLLNEDFNQALGRTANLVSEQVVLGSAAAVRALESDAPPRAPSVFDRFDSILESVDRSTGALFWVLLAIVALLLATIVGVFFWGRKNRSQARTLEHENALREQTVVGLARAVHASRDQPWADELLDNINYEFRDTEHGGYLRSLLRRENLRVRSGRANGRDTPSQHESGAHDPH
ncbi:MAG: hypothetical protein H0U74_04045 [Bradymonadaceae bacterium]|nr:hypothetical protein [Lujinxingiaceae bacterium]